MKHWYRVQMLAETPNVADVFIDDVIASPGDEAMDALFGTKTLTAKSFIQDLVALPKDVKAIRVHINSPGGDAFGAINIANALRDQQVRNGRTVETVIEGLAASAASVVAMAGNPIRMSDNALLMIHNPWTQAIGNAAELRKTADSLDQLRAAVIATYKWHSPLSEDEIAAYMDEETMFGAQEALDAGFVTEIEQGLRAAACIPATSAALLKVPDEYKDRFAALIEQPDQETAAAEGQGIGDPVLGSDGEPEDVAPAATVLQLASDAGLDLPFATQLLGEKLSVDKVSAKVMAERDRRAEETRLARERADREAERVREITAACAVNKMPKLADMFIAAGMDLTMTRAAIQQIHVLRAGGDVDITLPVDAGAEAPKTRKAISSHEIYSQLNARRQ